MIRTIRFLDLPTVDPVHNLALERVLFERLPEDELVLLLWQNDHTVVIGRNQNIRQEVDLPECERYHVRPVRRCSGGGAVYHDLGNLNFTFMAASSDYHQDLYARLIARALRSFNLEAEISGRNDLTVEGRKFSGCAFYHTPDASFMHGTLLVNTDLEVMTACLHPDPAKLKARGVASVRSRVVNLQELCPRLTVTNLKEALKRTVSAHYNLPLTERPLDEETIQLCAKLEEKYGSPEWIYGSERPYTHLWQKRFSWGSITLNLDVQNDTITQLQIHSDSLQPEMIQELQALLTNCPFTKEEIIKRLNSLNRPEKEDLISLTLEQEM